MKRERGVRDQEDKYKTTLLPLVNKISVQKNTIDNLTADNEKAWKVANEWESWSNETEKK